jgi:crotonobetaine/carnitine-CoA ligase
MRTTEDDVVMLILPLFHVNALFYSLGSALAARATLSLVARFSASRFWTMAVSSGATQVNVMEAIGSILKARPRDEFDAKHRIRAIYGVRENAAETFRVEFGIPNLITGFGMSEIPGFIFNPWEGPRKAGSMGVIGRHPDASISWGHARIVDDAGNEVERGETGELLVKAAAIMKGYFRDPQQTADAFRDGWFATGDLVRQDDDGYFYFVSRKKDIIRRRGENISAAELERVIGAHPAVEEVAAIAVPSELGEDEILAVVVVRGHHSVTAKEVGTWCDERLATHKVPRFVAFAASLPHTPTHKVLKSQLRADECLRRAAVDLRAGSQS